MSTYAWVCLNCGLITTIEKPMSQCNEAPGTCPHCGADKFRKQYLVPATCVRGSCKKGRYNSLGD